MKRRCFCHDYFERGIYMITLEVAGRRPLLGKLVGERIAPTPLGEAVSECWRQIPFFHPEVQLLECAVMPDHFHGLLFVRRRMARHLGEVVRGFKMGCTKAYRAMYGAPPDQSSVRPGHPGKAEPVRCSAIHGGDTLFAPGYHDRILTHKGQLDTLFNYIRDNPRRLATRLAHPDYFTRINRLALAGNTFAAYGNPFLLNRPDRLQIQCSRRITPDALAAEQSRLLDAAERGAVLVSPCISPGEKQIARAALDEGLPLIVLLANSFAPKYKPPGCYFEACANGLLLMLAPVRCEPSGGGPSGGGPYMARITRAQCLALNQAAADICGPGAAKLDYAGLVPLE